jgi:predicted porin
MNRKLISLAVAAALVAPAAAMAEAVLYGKLNVSLDYADVDSAILPYANTLTPLEIRGGAEVNRPGIWVGTNAAGTAAVPFPGVPTPNTVNTPIAPFGTRAAIVPQTVGGGQKFSGWGMNNGYIPNSVVYNPAINYRSAGGGRASRLGVKGSEELGGGLKAIYQIELGINPTDTNNNLVNNADLITYRNTFVGLAGGFGTALMGRHDTPLKISTGKLDLFADTLADLNATVGFQDLRADNAVAYISPSFSGFTLAAALVPSGGSTGIGSLNTESDQINGGWSIAGIYSNGPFYASAAYESLNAEMFNDNTRNFGCAANAPMAAAGSLWAFNPGAGAGACANSDDNQTQWRFGLGLLDWNGFSLTGIYAHMENLAGSDWYTTGQSFNANQYGIPTTYNAWNWWLPGGPDKMDLWQISAGYAFGNSQIKAMYGASTFDTDYVANAADTPLQLARTSDLLNGDRSTWAVGYDYNFSKRTKVYALYTSVEDDRSDWVSGSQWDGFSLGMMHSF